MSQTTVAPLAPMTPDAAISAFSYLRAVQAGDTEAAGEFAAAEPRLAAQLVDVAEQLVVPVTALLPGQDTGKACEDTYALEALGRVFITTLRTWEQAGPDASEGIARAVIAFTAQILTEDHEDVTDMLYQQEALLADGVPLTSGEPGDK
jgi:hypothetical protein